MDARRWDQPRTWAFALLGLLLCLILPLGAIGTMDAGVEGVLAVPLSRSAGRQVAELADRGPVEQQVLRATGTERQEPVVPRALLATVPVELAAVVAVLVALALVAPVPLLAPVRPARGLPHRRGPPPSR